LYDLRKYEQKLRETTRVYLEPQDADYIFERIVAASPELFWSCVIDPQRRSQWQAIKEVKNTRNSSGRMGVDAEFHCDHGSFYPCNTYARLAPFSLHDKHHCSNFSQTPNQRATLQGDL